MSVVPSILEKKGIEAIKAKNMPEAFELLYEAYTNGERTDNILIGIALVSRSLSKFEISLKTADQFLQRNPNDVNANLVKADALNALGRESVAVGFYAAALRLSKEIQRIPPLLANDLERAKKACEIASRKMKSEIEQLINEVEHLEIKNSTRIEQMFDILIGKKQIYHQKPSKLYFPELPQIQFFEAIDFEWSQALIEARQEIKEELNQILTSEELFKPYLDHNPDAATGNTGLNLDNNWSAFHLVRDGKEISQNISM
ncbi:MAG: hypothetical protein L3J46_08560, partial [Kangiellaceae bacterium]|nr:hypothetical protein [Kangiellaceae bacterium]